MGLPEYCKCGEEAKFVVVAGGNRLPYCEKCFEGGTFRLVEDLVKPLPLGEVEMGRRNAYMHFNGGNGLC